MKKGLLLLGTFAAFASYAQDCSRPFISEYVEGWSNNKALEIYNPTNQTIDLSEYFVQRYSNGSSTASPQGSAQGKTIQLSGMLGPYQTHVAVVDLRDPNGSGNTAPVWDSLQAKADAFYCNDYDANNVFFFNGNDALVLAKGDATAPNGPSTILCDVFGKIGEDPLYTVGSESYNGWSSVSPFNGTAAQSGNAMDRVVTEDHSMLRKSTVLKGIQGPNPIVPLFNPLAEYDSIPAVIPRLDENGDFIYNSQGNLVVDGNWSTLGWHECACDPNSAVNKSSLETVSVYPNPTSGIVFVKGADAVTTVEVFNGLGQLVTSVEDNSMPVVKIDLGQKAGVYMIRLVDRNGASSTKRLIVK